MKVEVLKHTDRKITMAVTGGHHSIFNAIRRTLMTSVPKLAIQEVTIYDNRSALFDETVAHRLGLLPVPTDLAAMTFRHECTCGGEGCANCTVLFTLTYEGPGTVLARDLQPVSPEHAIAEPDVPIVKLARDQRIMLEATAVLGRGADHAKWQPVVAASFRPFPTVKVKGPLKITADQKKELVELAPEGSLEVSGNDLKILDQVAAHDHIHNLHGRIDLENVTLGEMDDRWLFEFETDGALSPKDAFQAAIKFLMDKLKGTETAAGEL